MTFNRILQIVTITAFCYGWRPTCAQERAVEVSGCELAKNPKEFDQRLIRVRGTLNVHFEDFSLGVGECQTRQGIWLAFGGDVPGIVPSTANDNARKPGSPVKVEGISYQIRKDHNFRRLYALIAAHHGDKPDYVVTTTLTGKFFAGVETRPPNGAVTYMGYGHLGCCSLLLITEVSDVDSFPPANLTLRGSVVGPDGKPLEGLTVIDDVIGGTPPQRQKVVTNKGGEFTFHNAGQQLRVRDPKYKPVALTVEPGSAVIRLVLEDANDSDWIVPPCGKGGSSSRTGFSVLYALPSSMQSSVQKYTDHESIFIYAKGEDPVSAELIIYRHLDGTIVESDSLDSEQFESRWIKNREGKILGIDSRGSRSGGRWREAAFFTNETAGYWLRSGNSEIHDSIIDSACISEKK